MCEKIAACIVTYNRKELLLRCLNAIHEQTLLPDAIIIADNASTDGTLETLIREGLYDLKLVKTRDDALVYTAVKSIGNKEVCILFLRKKENDGGAGGFYAVMQEAYELGYDWLWMMDDDGLPDMKQLELLLHAANDNHIDYANALVLDIKDPTRFSFGLTYKGKPLTVEEAKSMSTIEGVANPWNGTLVHRRVIETIGFVKKEMFIWGDEVEYQLRTQKHGFKIATIPSAVHYHKGYFNSSKTLSFLKWKIDDRDIDERFMYSHKNRGYILTRYYSVTSVIRYFVKCTLIYLTNFKFKTYIYFLKYFCEGIFNRY